jgi:membrane protein YqaA with SNARE-associated domain
MRDAKRLALRLFDRTDRQGWVVRRYKWLWSLASPAGLVSMSYFDSFARAGTFTERWPGLRRWYPVLIALLAALVILTAWYTRGFILSLRAGYLGVFLLNLFGSATMIVPVPALISVCGFSTVLFPLAIGLVAGTGETIGEITGYALGFGGGVVIENRRFYPRLQRMMAERGGLVIFLVSIIPNPVFDIVGIAAGGLRYPVHRFLAIVFVGKVIKGTLIAYACYYGYSILPWVG